MKRLLCFFGIHEVNIGEWTVWCARCKWRYIRYEP
jgi:hypothetical protein